MFNIQLNLLDFMVSLKFGLSFSDRTLDFFLKRIEIPNFTYEVTEIWPKNIYTPT